MQQIQLRKSFMKIWPAKPWERLSRRLSWRCSGTDQKGSVMREDPLWHLLVLVLFLLSDFLGKLSCLCQPSRVEFLQDWHKCDILTLLLLSQGTRTSSSTSHEWPPGNCLTPNANSFPSLPLQINPFPSTPSSRHICPCLWQHLTLLSPHLHKPPLKCSPVAFLDFSLLLISKQIPTNVSYSYEMCVLTNIK